jgi:hypothetical protein
MEKEECRYHQLSFFHLLRGSAGGRALRDQRGKEYFSEMARNAAARRTKEERRAIAKKAKDERRRRLFTTPRTEVTDWSVFDTIYRITERVIPWWPHQKSRRRRTRPIFVRIELSVEQIERQEEADDEDLEEREVGGQSS